MINKNKKPKYVVPIEEEDVEAGISYAPME